MISLFSFLRSIGAARRLTVALLLAWVGGLVPSAWSQIIIGPGPGQVPVFTTTNIIKFAQTNFFAQEDSIQALITIIREGSLTNLDFVSVDFVTLDGTAISGTHYYRPATTTLFFAPGIDRVQFAIPLIDNFSVGGNVFANLVIRNPGSGTATFAQIGDPGVATLTIVDDESVSTSNPAGFVEIAPGNGGTGWDFGIEPGTIVATRQEWQDGRIDLFNEANFAPYGPAGVQFTIVRKGGSRGKILVDWRTTTNVVAIANPFFFFDFFGGFTQYGGLAVPNEDFNATNGTVELLDYQMSANVLVTLPANLQYEEWRNTLLVSTNIFDRPPSTFGVEITGVRPAPEEAGQGLTPQLGTTTQRRVALVDVTRGFAFTRKQYVVREGQRFVRIRVRRSLVLGDNPFGGVHVHYAVNPVRIVIDEGGDHQDNRTPLNSGSDYTSPFVDYEPPGTPVWDTTMLREREAGRPQTQNDDLPTLTWGDNEVTDRYIVIPLFDDNDVEFNEDLKVVLYKHDAETDGYVNPYSRVCTIKIIDNDQPAGASENDFNPDSDPLTDPPYMTNPGANGPVEAVLVQPDGKVILGGAFTAVNTADRNGIARLNFDGSTDRSFRPGTGVAGFVRALALQPDGKILIGGFFDAINGITRFSLARLHPNGSVDQEFNPGNGPDAPVRAIAVQNDGKILIGGEFNNYNGTNRNYFARLNPNGSLDDSFQIGAGPDGPVNSIALTSGFLDLDRDAAGGPEEDRFGVDTGSSRGTVTINYDFLQVADQLRVYYGNLLIFDTGLINSNGTITLNYPPAGVPADTTLLEVVVNEGGSDQLGTIWFYDMIVIPQVDPRPVIGGEFTEYAGTPINFIARVNVDGSLDATFDPGTGADDAVYSVAKQGNKVIMAGDFSTVDLRVRNGVARLNEDGSLDLGFDPGTGFDNTVYNVTVQPNGRPVLGGAFRSFNSTRRVGLARLNLDGTLDTSFMDTAKNQFAGIPNPLSPANPESQENFIRSVAPYRLTNFNVVTNVMVDTNGMTNFIVATNIVVTDHLFAGGRFSRFGGGFLRDQIRPRENIARINGGITPGPGNISFTHETYSVDENAGRTFITLTRTNGSLAPVSARFDAGDFPATGPGLALSGLDYFTTNTVPIWIRSHAIDREYSAAFMGPNFNVFSTNRQVDDYQIYQFPVKPPIRNPDRDLVDDNIFVDIRDDNAIEGPEVIRLRLTAPDEGRLLLGGEPIPVGTALGKADATLTIADNDFDKGTLGFSSVEYFVNENVTDAVITLTREGGSSGQVSVDVSTRNGTAGDSDYNGITTRTITFLNGMTSNKFSIRIRQDNDAELEETVFLSLTNAVGFDANIPLARRLDPARSTAVLNILDDDFTAGRISFTAPIFTVIESENELQVTVRRSGGNNGDVSVNYRTSNGSARSGEDYVQTQGTLQWTHEESGLKSFVIPLIGDDVVEGEETINLTLFNPTITDALGVQPTAVVRIQNDDAVGTFAFSQPVYLVDENGPYADISVIRYDGISGNATIRFSATNLTAVGTTNVNTVHSTNGPPDYVFPEYVAQNGFTNVLRFVEGQSSASFRIPLVDDNIIESFKEVTLTLFEASAGARFGLTNATLSIIDDELANAPAGQRDNTFEGKGTDDYVYKLALQPDGRILAGGDFQRMNDVVRNRLARLQPNGLLDPSYDPGTGPNNSVRALNLQPDGRLFVAGLFREFRDPLNHLARVNVDGLLDPTFNPGSGTDNPIIGAVQQADGKFLVVGNFTRYRERSRRGIARIGTNGVADVTFDPGTGANGSIWAVALQMDGKILIGGDFTTFNEIPRNRIARLNRDGSVDTGFGTSEGGANNSVRTIVVQSDANILIGGLFTTIDGRPFNYVARLLATGSQAGRVDDTFTLGLSTDNARATNGANGAVNVIALQIDGKILLGGDFTQFNSRTRNRITRLNADGSLDPTINFGSGANGPVSDLIVQPDRRILLAGGFTEYDGAAALHIARIHGGSLSGSGRVQFSSPLFTASESDENALVGIRRVGGTRGSFSVDFITTTTDSAVPGVDFTLVTNRVLFPEAETFRTVLIPLRRNPEVLTNRFIRVILTNIIGDGTMGVQNNARVTIENVDSQLAFSEAEYSIAENFGTGSALITVRRVGSTVGPLAVDVYTEDITATAGSDYGSIRDTLLFEPGQNNRSFAVPIFNDTLVEPDERIRLVLTNLVGNGIISRPVSILTINEDDSAPGQIEFTSATYLGTEGSGQIIVRLRRVGGTTGVISVDYNTRPGGEVQAETPSDYRGVANGIVSFSEGLDTQSFVIDVNEDNLVEGNESFIIALSNPRGGTSIRGATEAFGIIVDDDLPAGSLDRDFDPGTAANGDIRVVKLVDDGDIFIGGDFTIFNNENRLRIARLNNNASVDPSFDPGVGANGTVADIEFEPNGKLVLGGNFNTFQGEFLNRVARLHPGGLVDTSFLLPLGVNAEVTDLLRQPDGKIVIGGMFDITSAAGRNHIARLNTDGTVDLSFNPGIGTDNNVHAVALQPDGSIVIGGSFTTANGVFRRGIVRLNASGSVDINFNAGGAGASGAVYDILLLEGGKMLIVGDFTAYNGVNRARVARLNADGSLDTTFDPGVGPNRVVYAVAQQKDGEFIIVGDFIAVSGATRNRVARLNTDGSHDLDFKPGSGANAAVLTVGIQPQDGKVVVGGRFTEFDNVPRGHIARLNNDRDFIIPRDVMFEPIVRVGGNLRLTISSQTGFSYTLQATSTVGGGWSPVGSQVATGDSISFEIIPSENHQFFRVVRE